MCGTANQCSQINSDKLILYTVAGKVIDVDVRSEATVLREKQSISFA